MQYGSKYSRLKTSAVADELYFTRQKNGKGYLLEAGLWVSGVATLALMEPTSVHAFSFCPFSWIWERGCPGCGLGHAIAFLFRGDVAASWQSHPLGIPALAILGYRVVELVRLYASLGTAFRQNRG